MKPVRATVRHHQAPLHSWTWPERPWERIHIDYLGSVEAVDAHSKWPEVIIVNRTTSAKTVAVLGEKFARNGLPLQLQLVSDNGPQFCSEEFQQFMATNGIIELGFPWNKRSPRSSCDIA